MWSNLLISGMTNARRCFLLPRRQKTWRQKTGSSLACVLSLLIFCCCLGCHQDQSGRPLAIPRTTPTTLIHFTDVAEATGLHYTWQIPGKRPLNILQTIGNGCAFLDYDHDGNLDILLIGTRLALYRGDGKGHFADVTTALGLGKISGHFLGCTIGDYDNDGYVDIYLSGYRCGMLLHNDHGTHFSDVTHRAGIRPQPWGTSCTWAETQPGSGRLDLFIANYARFGQEPGIPQLCDSRGIQTSCGPRYYKPLHGVFYRNLGQGRFLQDDQRLALQTTRGRALGVAFAPLDGSGRPTLAIANDEMFGDLLSPTSAKEEENPHYTNIASAAGVSGDRDGNIHGGMGADWGDYDNDGHFDLFVATFENEAKSLYHNDCNGSFSDATYLTGIAPLAMKQVAFGCKFLDVDNDGALDLVIANGHVQDNIQAIDAGATYRQQILLLHNKIGGSSAAPTAMFENLGSAAGTVFTQGIVGRGLAIGDFDNDGRMDILVVDSEGSPLLLHNETSFPPNRGHWLGVKLVGTHCNRDAIGAVVIAMVGRRSLTRLCHTDGSYLSASDSRLHFGLDAAATVDTLTVRWPDGRSEVWKHVAADRYITLREGSALRDRP